MKKEDVTLHKDCVSCLFFGHWMWTGAHPVLCCNYVEPHKEKEEKEEGEDLTQEEPEETETGKEWRQPDFVQQE